MNMKKEYRKELRQLDKASRALGRQATIDRRGREKAIAVINRQYLKGARARMRELGRIEKRCAILAGRLS